MLRFDPDVRNAQVHLAPALPEWIDTLTLRRVPLMGGHLSIEVDGDHCNVLELPDGLSVVPEPRRPTV